MRRYTLHINLNAESDAAAIEQARHITEDLIRRPIGSWDVSGQDENGQRDWSLIIPRSERPPLRHNAFHQKLNSDAMHLYGDHDASDCEEVENSERTIESDLAEGR